MSLLMLGALLSGDAAPASATSRLQPAPAALRYQIDAEVDFAGAYVTATERVTWRNTAHTTVRELVFNVTPANDRAFQLRGCSLAGADCEPTLHGVVMEVPLAAPLAPGDEIELELRFFLDVPEPGNLRFGKAGGILALGNWYPTLAVYREGALADRAGAAGWDRHPYTDVGDAFFTEAADYDVTVRTGAPLTIAASGRRVERSDTAARYAARSLRDFAVALSDRYEVVSRTVNGTQISVFTTPAHAAGAGVALDAASAALTFLEANVGPYAWSELHVAETTNYPGAWDGQEYSGVAFISAHHLAQPGPPGSYLWYLVAHEVVHQWFYAAVGDDQLYDPWLDEAFATQLAWLTLRSVSPDAYAANWAQLKSRWASARATYGDLPVDVGVYDFRPETEAAYFAVVYRKGALFLDDVRLGLGDDAYFALLRDHYAAQLYRIATPEAFFALVRARLGEPGDALIATYFR